MATTKLKIHLPEDSESAMSRQLQILTCREKTERAIRLCKKKNRVKLTFRSDTHKWTLCRRVIEHGQQYLPLKWSQLTWDLSTNRLTDAQTLPINRHGVTLIATWLGQRIAGCAPPWVCATPEKNTLTRAVVSEYLSKKLVKQQKKVLKRKSARHLIGDGDDQQQWKKEGNKRRMATCVHQQAYGNRM